MFGPAPVWEVFEGLTISEVSGSGKEGGRVAGGDRAVARPNVYSREKIAD